MKSILVEPFKLGVRDLSYKDKGEDTRPKFRLNYILPPALFKTPSKLTLDSRVRLAISVIRI